MEKGNTISKLLFSTLIGHILLPQEETSDSTKTVVILVNLNKLLTVILVKLDSIHLFKRVTLKNFNWAMEKVI